MFEVMVTVTGNVIADPEVFTTRNGVPYAGFRVATTSRRFDKQTGSMIKGDTLYLHVRCWRALARNVTTTLTKGTPVVIQGKLITRTVAGEGPDGPQRRQSTELDATAIGVDLARVSMEHPSSLAEPQGLLTPAAA